MFGTHSVGRTVHGYRVVVKLHHSMQERQLLFASTEKTKQATSATERLAALGWNWFCFQTYHLLAPADALDTNSLSHAQVEINGELSN